MDPEATIQGIADGMSDGDWQQVADCADALIGWLARGGFAPAGWSRPMEYARDARRYALQRGACLD
ncbi:MAG: hypothetical protein GY720_15800 [bacterium]|nr:hypothetical protein [bacterium]